MKKMFFGMAAAAAWLLLTGCIQFADCPPMPGDAAVDEANVPFVREAKRIYDERTKFRRNLELKPSADVNVFLSRDSFSQYRIDFKRDLLFTVKNALVGQLAGMRDFELVGQADTLSDDPQVTAAAGKKENYLMTFSITKLEFEKSYGLGDVIGNVSKKNSRQQQQTNYCGRAEVQICLYDPSGKQLFVFKADEKSRAIQPSRDGALLKEAVESAALAALYKYSVTTAPPLYVTRTVGNGSFAQISGGSAYGINAGSRIRFYRHAVRTGPALPGEAAQQRVDEIVVGEGVVGAYGAPVEQDSAWVFIGDFRDPEKQPRRTVFEWTSAKLIH